MQPRSRVARPVRDERVFHVTNRGLRDQFRHGCIAPKTGDALLVVRKRGFYGCGGDESTIKGIEGVETVFRKTDIGSRLLDSAYSRIRREKGHQGE
jgi:hypothetical protein